jgi:diguanylate cyclase (GGDEF)-like protein/PAS domain S-box-containing protein
LHDSPLQVGPRRRNIWWHKHAYASRLASCFIWITLATVFVRFFERSEPTVNLIWVANGLLLTYLLLAPRWRWPGYLAAGAAAMMVGSALIGESWQTNLLFNALNLVEILIGALLLRKKSTQLPRFTDRGYLARFVVYAVFVSPIAAGAILALVTAIWTHAIPLKVFRDWLVADGLGAAVIVPTFVAIFETRFRISASLKQHWQYPVTLAAVTVIAFSQNRMPLFILIFPVLVLLLMRLGLGWAALATLFIAAAAGWYTLHNSGPFAASNSAYTVETSVQVQFFFACCIFMIYIVSVVMEDRNATEYRLQEIASIHELVTDNSRDVILLADLDGRSTYISPAVESMKGRKPEELIHHKLSELAHPDDRAKLDDAVLGLRHGSEGAILEYRTQKRNGEYIWVESSLRMYRDRRTGIPAGILGLVRDITERKRSESLLLEAYRALEELAVVDALTGVANRRRFDEYLASEWSWSARLQRPISLLLIDADSLKEQNDLHGHLSGDSCLKRIAEAATHAANRPKDLIARFGGDEFAVILPDTDASGAIEVAGKLRARLKGCDSEFDEDSVGLVTISIGCATSVPKSGEDAAALIQVADELLYRAKRSGRDQLCHSLVAPSAGA